MTTISDIKYPRTYHLPWSEGATNDDKISKDVSYILNRKILISEKLDGSNCCLTRDNCFARSHSGPASHESFDIAKAFHSTIKFDIPDNILMFIEHCYAKHSIFYSNLKSYYNIITLFDLHRNMWLSFDDIQLYSEVFQIPTVPILYSGVVSSEKELYEICSSLMKVPSVYGPEREGVVIRVADEFSNDDFYRCVLKQVRKDHVTTSEHWKNQRIVKNIIL